MTPDEKWAGVRAEVAQRRKAAAAVAGEMSSDGLRALLRG